ncbi:MAG: DUF5011 domain-containing protein [Ferruginibacter sp.]
MKKKYSFLAFAILMIALISSCKKDPIISTHDKVGISKVTYFANITLTGNNVMSVIKGASFTDPGVKAEAAGKDIQVKSTGSVNTDQVGVYILNYSAVNADGFSSSASRTVVVIPTAEVAGIDLSGTYNAVPVGATPAPAQISKVAEGVYYTTNCWGNNGAVIPAYFISTDGISITVPTQGSPYGSLESTTPGTYNAGLITWSINLIDQGAIRIKKWQK